MTTEEIEPVGFINAQGGFLLTDAGAEWFKAALANAGPASVGVTALPLYASLPSARVEEGPRVKALEWGPYPVVALRNDEVAVAVIEFNHRYQVQRDPWGPGFQANLYPEHGTEWWISKGHATLDEAKAAAQADYEARIRGSLQ